MNEDMSNNEAEAMQTCAINEFCRLCANLDDNMVSIYADEGADHMLENKIKIHLPFINISKNDLLPKKICYHCASTVLVWNELYECSSEADQKLRSMFGVNSYEQSDCKIIQEDERLNPSLKSDISNIFDRVNDDDESVDHNMYLNAVGIDDDDINGLMNCHRLDLSTSDDCDGLVPKREYLSDPMGDPKENLNLVDINHHYQPQVQDHNNMVVSNDHIGVGDITDINTDANMGLATTNSDHGDHGDHGDHINHVDHVDHVDHGDHVDHVDHGDHVDHVDHGDHVDHDDHDEREFKPQLPLIDEVENLLKNDCGGLNDGHVNGDGDINDDDDEDDEGDPLSLDIRQLYMSGSLSIGDNRLLQEQEETMCQICATVFKTRYNLLRHFQKRHPEYKMYECDLCRISFPSIDEFKDHLEEKHSKIQAAPNSADPKQVRFACDVCGNMYKNKASAMNHLLTHTAQKTVECNQCDFTCYTKQQLGVHQTKHDKRFVCDICNKRFAQKSQLDVHVNAVHYNQRPYHCVLCKKSFKTKGSHDAHMIVHTDTRNYQCPHCDKKCRKRYDLTLHIRTHTGEKPFKCSVCGRGFVQMCDTRKHEMLHFKPGKRKSLFFSTGTTSGVDDE